MKKLTIAIPTYNRNVTLNESLAHWLPQLTEQCRLLILDDHSPFLIADTVGQIVAKYPGVDVEIRRNKWNIGLVANVLRCFEYCETEWIWVPGDDDIMLPDAVQTVLKTLTQNPDACYLSFVTQGIKDTGARKETFKAYGLDDFADKLDMAHLVNFMSCSVWKTEVFSKNLSSGYHNAYSNGWTFALLLSGIGATGEVVFSHEAVVQEVTIAPTATRWSYRKFVLGWVTLLEIPSSRKVRKILAKKMLSLYSPENVTAYLLADAATRSWPGRFFYYDLAVGRLSPYRLHFFARFRFALYRPLFAIPALGWKMVRLVIRLANRLGLKNIDINDLETRSDR